MKEKMILKNGQEIAIESGASLSSMHVLSADKQAMIEVWNTLTADNLSDVKILNGDGFVIGKYNDLLLVSETSMINTDGSISTSFNLREKTDIEKRLDALEAGQSVQDGAIIDVADVVSYVADKIEGGYANG